MQKDTDIKYKLYSTGIKHWQVAQELGVHPNTLTNWFRCGLTDGQRKDIDNAIEKLLVQRVEELSNMSSELQAQRAEA